MVHSLGSPHVLLLLLLLLMPALGLAQGISGSLVYQAYECASVCSPAYSFPASFSNCVSTCNGCLIYWFNCYSAFHPWFNGDTFSSYSCYCYLPWWAWLIVSFGFLLSFLGFFFCARAILAQRQQY